MNVRTVKEPEKRIEVPNITNLNIQAYGHDNLYPQQIQGIVATSESGSGCLMRYIQFIQGNGFKNVSFAETVLNTIGDTADDILQQVADDLGSFDGFALHLNYNLSGHIVEINHVPFENCRLGEEDEQGYVSKIAVFPDWSGKKKRGNKQLKPTKESVDYIDIFNPVENVVRDQIEAAGGIEKYKGQILWISNAGKQQYPKPVYDCVITQMSTEEGLGNISYRNTRNNFNPSGMLITKKGQNIAPDEEDGYNEDEYSIAQEIGKVQGDINSNKILSVEVEYDEEIPQFVNFQGANYDKDYTVTSDNACEKIYAAFSQEAWYRIRKGSLGFSSEVLIEAYENYSTVTGIQRRMIERAFDKIFKYWHEQINTTDYTIQPLKYISSSIGSEVSMQMYEKDILTKNQVLSSAGFEETETGNKYISETTSTPLAVRLGVGGTQALQSILLDESMSNDAKIGALEVLFSLTNDEAKKLVLGNQKSNIFSKLFRK